MVEREIRVQHRLCCLFSTECTEKKPIQIGNLNCPKMFGLVDYHVVTDTISLGSIPGEGVGRSGALPGISSSSSPIPHGSWTTQYIEGRHTGLG